MSSALDVVLQVEAIRRLVYAYVEAADRGRSRDLADLFAPDGVLEIVGESFDSGVHAGPQAIFDRLERSRADLAATMKVPLLRHHVSSLRVTVADDGTHASAASYFLALTDAGPDHWGRYADRFVRTEGGWRFAHRRVIHEGRHPGGWLSRAGEAVR